jgi:hypothetical protein
MSPFLRQRSACSRASARKPSTLSGTRLSDWLASVSPSAQGSSALPNGPKSRWLPGRQLSGRMHGNRLFTTLVNGEACPANCSRLGVFNSRLCNVCALSDTIGTGNLMGNERQSFLQNFGRHNSSANQTSRPATKYRVNSGSSSLRTRQAMALLACVLSAAFVALCLTFAPPPAFAVS